MNYFYIRLLAIVLSSIIVTVSNQNQQQTNEAPHPNAQIEITIPDISISENASLPTHLDVTTPTINTNVSSNNVDVTVPTHNQTDSTNSTESTKSTLPTEPTNEKTDNSKYTESDNESTNITTNKSESKNETTIPITNNNHESSDNREDDVVVRPVVPNTQQTTIPTTPTVPTVNDVVEDNKETTPVSPPQTEKEDAQTVRPPETEPTEPPQQSYQKPKNCETHSMILVDTVTNAKYSLYQYVTDTYKCEYCEYSYSDAHIGKITVSEQELLREENVIVELVNALRRKNGLQTLVNDPVWKTWANVRSEELSIVYGHNRPDGGSWCHMIGKEMTFGENVAAGESSGEAFYNAFFNSPSHKSLMLDSQATKIAVSIYIDETGTPYCAMVVAG